MTTATTRTDEERRQRLLDLQAKHELTPKRIGELALVQSRAAVNRWLRGERYPSESIIGLLELQLGERKPAGA